MSKRLLHVYINYSMCDLIYGVISRSVRSCDVDKINVYDKIMIQNQKKRENMEIEEIFT